jgi:hypothetical protein
MTHLFPGVSFFGTSVRHIQRFEDKGVNVSLFVDDFGYRFAGGFSDLGDHTGSPLQIHFSLPEK